MCLRYTMLMRLMSLVGPNSKKIRPIAIELAGMNSSIAEQAEGS